MLYYGPMKSTRWLTIALFCVAWLLLLFRLDAVPPGFQHDQTFDAMNALQVVGGEYSLYFPVNFGLAPASCTRLPGSSG